MNKSYNKQVLLCELDLNHLEKSTYKCHNQSMFILFKVDFNFAFIHPQICKYPFFFSKCYDKICNLWRHFVCNRYTKIYTISSEEIASKNKLKIYKLYIYIYVTLSKEACKKYKFLHISLEKPFKTQVTGWIRLYFNLYIT